MKFLSAFLAASLVSLAQAEFSLSVSESVSFSNLLIPPEISIKLNGSIQNPVHLYFLNDEVSIATCQTTLPVGTSSFSLPLQNFVYTPSNTGKITVKAVDAGSCLTKTSDVTIHLPRSSQTCDFTTKGNQFGGTVFAVSPTDSFVVLYKTTSPIQTATGSVPLSVIAQMSNVGGAARISSLTILYDTRSMILRPGSISAARCPDGLTCERSTSPSNAQNLKVSLEGFFSIKVIDYRTYLGFEMTLEHKMYPLSSGTCVPTEWISSYAVPAMNQVSTCPAFDTISPCVPVPNPLPTSRPVII